MRSKKTDESKQNVCLITCLSTTVIVRSTGSADEKTALESMGLIYDHREKAYRGHAMAYRRIVLRLMKDRIPFLDEAKLYGDLKIEEFKAPSPYDYQTEALQAWLQSKWGVVVLPTGAGKSVLGGMVIRSVARPTLVLVPTIDLMRQWRRNLSGMFHRKIGGLGGGEFDVLEITVSTYDSARIHIEKLSRKFGLAIFDECHHMPSPGIAETARALLAPYRLGLTATPPEEEDRMEALRELTGDIKYNKDILELAGDYLAPYEIRTITVSLTPEEKELYEYHRSIYLNFRKSMAQWGMARTDKWEMFVALASRTKAGREALKSFAVQKQLSIAAENKLVALQRLLVEHRNDKILIFTHDNKTAYLISSLFILPVLTHETATAERKKALLNFKTGRWPFLVSSRVLNEGVDIPDANVAVIISGTGTVREHVQRLGRILRKQGGKKAVLYEMVTIDTGEVGTSRRRRMHEAYINT